jgi:nucleoside-diphosphate-sugar epimerase
VRLAQGEGSVPATSRCSLLLAIGEHGVIMMTEARGASNEKAKRELDWRPRYASWRQGFAHGLG